MMRGRVDVHAHLLPAMDDGCANVEESLACARLLVTAGYSHAFCTAHIWPSLPQNTVSTITRETTQLQERLDEAGVELKLLPGGEINLRPDIIVRAPEEIPSYGMRGKACLFDLWADALPPFFEPAVRYLQQQGMRVIVAHPERMRVVQDDPSVVDQFQRMGLLLQGNLQCLSDPPESKTRQIIERFLIEGRYFLLGSDTHNLKTLPYRLDGLQRAIEVVGMQTVNDLTVANPRLLLGVGNWVE